MTPRLASSWIVARWASLDLPTLLAIGLVVSGNLALALPVVLEVLHLPPDAIGYVATARNLVEGRGFVEPIMYSYYLEGSTVPIPATAVRGPIVPLLFSLPLALGAGLVDLAIMHCIWSAAIASQLLLLGRRFMSLPAATAAAIGVAWSPSWEYASTRLLTEATSVGALLALLAIAPALLRTSLGAVGLATATLAAWLVRPNLGAFVLIVVVAMVLKSGLRATLHSSSLWTYVLSFVALQQLCTLLLGARFDIAPYAHYGVMAQSLNGSDVRSFQAEYAGAIGYTIENWQAISKNLIANIHQCFTYLFLQPTYLFVGWFVVPGLVYVLTRRSRLDLEHVLCAVGGVTFIAIAILTGWGFSAIRYPLLGAVCFWLVGMTCLDSALSRFSAGREGRSSRVVAGLIRGAPLLAVVLVFVVSISTTRISRGSTKRIETTGVYVNITGQTKWVVPIREFCSHMHKDAVVASPSPWVVYYECGNAGYLLPGDLSDLGWLHRYLDEMKPAYLITESHDDSVVFNRSERLRLLSRRGNVRFYGVMGAGNAGFPWNSPGPLALLGP